MSQAEAAFPAIDRDPRRLQVLFGGHAVADSADALVVRAPGAAPVWCFPRQDVEMDVLQATSTRNHAWAGPATYFTIYRDAHVAEDAAWSLDEPPGPLQVLAGYISFDAAHFDLFAHGETPADWAADRAERRLPRLAPTNYASVADLADALRRAAAAHERHEAEIGAKDPDWPDWYAAHMAGEQTAPTPRSL